MHLQVYFLSEYHLFVFSGVLVLAESWAKIYLVLCDSDVQMHMSSFKTVSLK